MHNFPLLQSETPSVLLPLLIFERKKERWGEGLALSLSREKVTDIYKSSILNKCKSDQLSDHG